MALLILVRHAETVRNPKLPSDSWKLSDSAGAACTRLVDDLREFRPNRIITSTHLKARETGRLLAVPLQVPYEALPGLEEQDRTGVPFVPDETAWLSLVERLFRRPDEAVLGGESASQALGRFREALLQEVERKPGENLVAVSHATVMALLIADSNELDPFHLWKTIQMPEAFVLELPTLRLLRRTGAA